MNKHLLGKLLLVQVFAVSYGRTQPYERELSVSLGDFAVLECQTEPSQLNKAQWRRQDIIISQGYRLNPSLHKYSIEGNQVNGDYFLKIYGIDETDLQSYWCETQTKSSAEVIQLKITLVLRPITTYPITSSLTSINEQVVTEKGSVQTTYIVYDSTKDPNASQHIETTFADTPELTTSKTSHISTSDFTLTSIPNDQGRDFTFLSASHISTSDFTLTSIPNDQGRDFTFLSGLTKNEKYILFGMVGVCFILVLVLSISCNICINRKCKKATLSNELNIVDNKKPLTSRPSMSETVSEYEYIDDEKLNMYIDPIHEAVPGLPMRITKGTESSVSSDRSYLEVVDEAAIVVHPCQYQSLKDIDKQETSGQYMQIANTPAILCRINSPEYYQANRPNSLTTETRQFGTDLICQLKRSCSWPNEFRHKISKQPVTFYLGSKEDCFEEEKEMFKRRCLSLEIVYRRNKVHIETKQNKQQLLEKNVTKDPFNVPPGIGNEWGEFYISGNNSKESISGTAAESRKLNKSLNDSEENLDKSMKTSNDKNLSLCSSLCLTDFESSSDNDSVDKMKDNSSLKDTNSYEKLSGNNLNNVHDYSVCSAPLSLNIF